MVMSAVLGERFELRVDERTPVRAGSDQSLTPCGRRAGRHYGGDHRKREPSNRRSNQGAFR